MTPVFLTRNINDTGYGKAIGAQKDHLRLTVVQDHSEKFAAIGFGMADKIGSTTDKKPFDAVYCIDENEWNGAVSIQLRLKDIR